MANFTGQQNQYWRTYSWGARKNAPHVWNFVPFRTGPRDARATCVACLWIYQTIQCYQRQQTVAAPAQEALLFCWVHTVASFHSAQLSSFILFLVSSLSTSVFRGKPKTNRHFLPRVLEGGLWPITSVVRRRREGLVLQILYGNTKSLDSVVLQTPCGKRASYLFFLNLVPVK